MRKRSSGFTLVEIMIVVAIIGILIAIAIPGFIKARKTSQAKACQENLSKIDGAKEQYALENKLGAGEAVPDGVLFGADKYVKVTPTCPATDDAYTIGTIGTDPTCPNQSNAEYSDHQLPQEPAAPAA